MEVALPYLPPAAQATPSLALLEFFLPRLLGADGSNPDVWVHALGLQQVGELALSQHARQVGQEGLPAELQYCQQALAHLGRYLARYYHLLPDTGWPYVQHQLRHTMPQVQRLLTQQAVAVSVCR